MARRIINIDVASYYPSLMINNGYCSRNMPHPDVFKGIYEERLAAKASGDEATANALKLIVNTTYGATLNQYNDLYDPLMARSVCISGQLYLLELACHLVRDVKTLTLIQLNTDGIMVSFDEEEYVTLAAIYHEWEERTGFVLEEDEIERVWQKDCNNYALRLQDGHEKVKGGYLVRGASTVGAFSINNNNATIVAEALKRHLLDGTPIADTIAACDDPMQFQLIAKAGHKYSRVYQEVLLQDGQWEQFQVQKCNRVFATTDEALGRLYKAKASDGRVAKIESLPEHCLICNDGMPSIESIDKDYYIKLAERRAQDFKEVDEKLATTTKTTRTTTEATDYSKLNVYQKLAIARKMFLESNPQKSGINPHQEFDYFELEDIVPEQTRIFAEVGLIELFHYKERQPLTVASGNDGQLEVVYTDALGVATVVNTDNSSERIEFQLLWGDVEPIISKRTGKPVNQPIQDTGGEQTFMRRYLKMQVLDIAEQDGTDGISREEIEKEVGEPKEKAPSASVTKSTNKPVTEAQRKTIAKTIANPDDAATKLQIGGLKKKMKSIRDDYGEEHPEVKQFIAELSASTDKLTHSAQDDSSPFSKAECEAAIQALGEMKKQFESAQ